ncbi:hypothetical protein [Muriventricola aceti]|uniref:hypothetical protein n=1 Tax=Muriventricola aceti TaxID=2981773 RepID=UPI0021D368E7|nr:hypothetical protein [Muriventricola aceti]MCU6702446.1 hypothetical protein [Muriventricola aceti]
MTEQQPSRKESEVIMTEKDIDGLFGLLSVYFPNNPKTKDKTLKNAWLLVLEEYGPEEVKLALKQFLRESKNFPFVQEIAMRCPRRTTAGERNILPGQSEQEHMERARKWQAEWHEELHKLGLPTMREALKQGMSLTQWNKALKEGGAWD